ncbi:acyltransferase family protein [Caballeronia cordobensis]|uniref:acyltransferase family protein n=1 Tax=Caballeronia cordobensis TaxID=1353886 RepID=UPI00045EF68E|nr:acyltransferase 3 [Burkholderia sp. RPE67]
MLRSGGTPAFARGRHLDALTSLRFFAAAMIVLGHAHGVWGSLGLAINFSLAQGVSFFFVLSGFILAYNYPQVERELARFYRARFARLWPLHIVAIMLLPIIAHTWNTADLSSAKAFGVFVANVFLVQSWIPFRNVYLTFNGVAWSISTEAFFYLAFPLAVVLLRRSYLLALGVAALTTFFFIWLVVHFQIPISETDAGINSMGLLYVNPLARLFEFVLGMVACDVYKRVRESQRPISVEGATVDELVMLAVIAVSMHVTPRLPWDQLLPANWASALQYYSVKSGSAIVFAIAIVIFALGRGAVSRALTSRALVFLGEASFALYLTHTTVLLWFERHPAVANSPAGPYLYWTICLVLASLLFVFVETPMRRVIIGKRPSIQPVEA